MKKQFGNLINKYVKKFNTLDIIVKNVLLF